MTRPIPNLTEVRDRTACSQLLALLDDASRELRALGEDPVVVASCPSKFNDASNDPDWRAIRVGGFFSQRTEYFGHPEEHDKKLRDGPESARTASRILENLEAGNWRELYQRAFERRDMSFEEVIALVLLDGDAWLVLNGSNSGESAVYSVTSGGNLTHVGRCDPYAQRFDQGLDEDRPLTIRRVEEDEADRAAVARRIEILERAAAGQRPDWYKPHSLWFAYEGMHVLEIQALARRLAALAETGRVSKEDFQSLKELLSFSVG